MSQKTQVPTPAPQVIVGFVVELIQRLFLKSPKFFNILSWISFVAFLGTGLPGVVEYLGIDLPENLQVLQNKVVGWLTAVVFYVSKLTVIDPTNLPLSGKK